MAESKLNMADTVLINYAARLVLNRTQTPETRENDKMIMAMIREALPHARQSNPIIERLAGQVSAYIELKSRAPGKSHAWEQLEIEKTLAEFFERRGAAAFEAFRDVKLKTMTDGEEKGKVA